MAQVLLVLFIGAVGAATLFILMLFDEIRTLKERMMNMITHDVYHQVCYSNKNEFKNIPLNQIISFLLGEAELRVKPSELILDNEKDK